MVFSRKQVDIGKHCLAAALANVTSKQRGLIIFHYQHSEPTCWILCPVVEPPEKKRLTNSGKFSRGPVMWQEEWNTQHTRRSKRTWSCLAWRKGVKEVNLSVLFGNKIERSYSEGGLRFFSEEHKRLEVAIKDRLVKGKFRVRWSTIGRRCLVKLWYIWEIFKSWLKAWSKVILLWR